MDALGVFDFCANRASVMEAYRAYSIGDVRMPGSDYLKYEGRPSYDRVINLLGYLGGSTQVSGSKLICSAVGNRARGLPRASGLMTLIDAVTQRPFCVLDASRVSAARTAAVTSVALACLAPRPIGVAAMLGCGYQASVHVRLMAALTDCRPQLIRMFDTDAAAARRLAADAVELGLDATVVDTPERAIRGADVVVPLSTAETPYRGWLAGSSRRFTRPCRCWTRRRSASSSRPISSSSTMKSRASTKDGRFSCSSSRARAASTSRRSAASWRRIPAAGGRDPSHVFNPMGTVITDIAVSVRVFERAMAEGVGVRLPLS